MTTEKTYQGWSSYETWAVALWIDNDQALYEFARSLAWEARRNAEEYGSPVEGLPPEKCARIRLVGRLRDWIEESKPDLGATLWADLLNAALSEVNWHEIAQAKLAELAEEATT